MVLKRLFDLTMSFVGMIGLSPVFLIIALLVKLSSSGPIFYRADRVGRYGKIFKQNKFRTMVIDADKSGPGVTGLNDYRITRVGFVLRRIKLDELPQLWNVFIGEMSFVGPRPEHPKYVELYSEQQREVLSVCPGITSPASIEYRSEEYFLTGENWEEAYILHILPAKLAIDLEYVRHVSLWGDIKLILKTLRLLFRRLPHAIELVEIPLQKQLVPNRQSQVASTPASPDVRSP